MSLNKFTDLIKKPWMNINANTITASNLSADSIETDNLVIESDTTPQILVKTIDPGLSSILELQSALPTINFKDDAGDVQGQIQYVEFNNRFFITSGDLKGTFFGSGVNIPQIGGGFIPTVEDDYTHLFGVDGNDSLFTTTVLNKPRSVVGTQFINLEDQSVEGSLAQTFTSMLTSTTPGVGSLTLPEGSLSGANGQAYELCISGNYSVSTPQTLRIAVYINNTVAFISNRFIHLDTIFEGSFTGTIYITGKGTSDLTINGAGTIVFSNSGDTATGTTQTVNLATNDPVIGFDDDKTIDLRVQWGLGTTNQESTTTKFSCLKKIY